VLFEEAEGSLSPKTMASHPPINPTFKLVFLTTALGTLLFVILSIGAHLWMGTSDLTGSLKSLVDTMINMAQLGCGAVAGLLGGYTANTTA
jgi:hypothetical protein